MAKNKKVTTSVKVITSILCILALIIGFVGADFVYIYLNKAESDKFVRGDFEAHFVELGNQYTGDCIYIRSGDTDILIDAGSRENSADAIIEYVAGFLFEFLILFAADKLGDVCRVLHVVHIAAYQVNHAVV